MGDNGASDHLDAAEVAWRARNPLRALRLARGVSRERLAGMLGVGLGDLQRWERGSLVPRITTLLRWEPILGVSVGALASSWAEWLSERPPEAEA